MRLNSKSSPSFSTTRLRWSGSANSSSRASASRDAFDQAEQAYKNSQADYESAVATTQSQKKQLGYYHIAAPFEGIVGDVPVHLGDYVSPTTMLTTVDENRDLEAYIYIPTERVIADSQRPAGGDSRQPGK